ncbi:MAG TPA: carboxypeptidase-like regulatory domain-containing protein, partial [Blastocatellia bacterium]
KVTHNGINQAQTDSQGRYTLRNVQANTIFTLRFVHPNNRLAVNFSAFVLPGETIVRNATFRSAAVRGKIYQPDGVTGTVAELTVFAQLPVLDEGPGFGELQQKEISTQSAGDGSYSVTQLNPGAYRVRASNSFFPTRVSKGGTLIAGEEQVCDITLVGALGGKVQGRVFQPDGTTAVGAGVKVTLGGGALADVTVRTDETGHYEFAEVFADGNYNLTATDATSGLTNRVSISIQQNKDVIADIRLLGRGTLRVRVIDGAGNAIQGGSITIDGTAHPRDHRFIEITPASGDVIQFNNLTEGPYAIVASQNGLSGRVQASIPNGGTVEATVQLQASGAVEGRVLLPDGVTGAGLADVFLTINNRRVGATVTSDEEGLVGKFRFDNVPAGEVILEAFDNRSGRTGRASGRINAQGETATVDIQLIPRGVVTGIITSNGAPVDHALVKIIAIGSPLLQATTSADGRYIFAGIPAGHVSLSATGPGGLTGQATGQVPSGAEPLPDTVINISLQPSITVIGTIYKLGGVETVMGARVTLRVGSRTIETTSDQNGSYRMEFVPT